MISIIFCGDIRYCPYLSRYTDRLDAAGVGYEVLFWNRGGFELEVGKNYKYYDKPSPEDLGKAKKLADFAGFGRWVKKQLSVSEPDGLIFLSTLSAILLQGVAKRYKNRYIFDIRDYSYENIGVFRKMEARVIKDSYFTAISSKGFRAFLPEHDYVIAHNFNRGDVAEGVSFVRKQEPYRIVWNGTVRFFDYQKKFLDVFGNDPRFMLVYHGAGTDLEKYRSYCREKGFTNVCFTGGYDNKDKAKLLADAAILNNCYGGRDGDELRYAISNRFYDGMVYRIPQMVEKGGYKAEVTKKTGVGIDVSPDESLPDRLYEYYRKTDKAAFDEACRRSLDEIIKEDDVYIAGIDGFISKYGRKEK